ncbi:MAG: hypothetical protein HY347_00755 [candidate division NC10 bacterium]|nr:hypothetical protein [candidate division NC10 bacterium]
MPRVTIYLTEAVANELEKFAKENNLSASWVLRRSYQIAKPRLMREVGERSWLSKRITEVVDQLREEARRKGIGEEEVARAIAAVQGSKRRSKKLSMILPSLTQ